MNCLSCGAPLELASKHGVAQCAYCDARRVLAGDGQGLDGVIFLGTPLDLDCPTCGDQLVAALLDDQPVRACPGCYGVAIPFGVFGHLVASRRAAYRGPDRPAAPIDPRELSRTRDCPICRESMEVHPYYGPGRSVIDSCRPCSLVWLDAGELRAIEQTPGRRCG